jgi:hypothetical protein
MYSINIENNGLFHVPKVVVVSINAFHNLYENIGEILEK